MGCFSRCVGDDGDEETGNSMRYAVDGSVPLHDHGKNFPSAKKCAEWHFVVDANDHERQLSVRIRDRREPLEVLVFQLGY